MPHLDMAMNDGKFAGALQVIERAVVHDAAECGRNGSRQEWSMKLKRPSGLSRYASPAFLGVVGIILATGTLSACGSSVESNNTTGAKPGDGLPCDVTKVLQDRC